MTKIIKLLAREILDSRGNPTVETTIFLDNGLKSTVSVPSGASTGHNEAVELRDGDKDRYNGMGVLNAIDNVNQIISPAIIGMDPVKQFEIDNNLIKMDGTSDKSKLGANAILSTSLAVCKVAALASGTPSYRYIYELVKRSNLDISDLKIPIPTFNLINGGKHGAGNLEFQEFHVIPSAKQSYKDSLEIVEEIYQGVERVLVRHGAIHSVGDEGGFAPNLFTNLDALEVIVTAIKECGYELKRDVFLGLDVAASNFFKNGRYSIRDRTQPMETVDLIEFYHDLLSQYPLLMIEDPLYEDDWLGWTRLNSDISQTTIIVGDDLLCTNPVRVKKAIDEKACGAVLVKPNQIGTLSETIEVIKIARKASWKVIVSHRSGETNDDFIADFAVGVGADYTKFGAPARGERVAKYNRLLEIEDEIKRN